MANKRKVLYALMTLLIIFGCIFLVALAHFFRKSPILGIGMGYALENSLVMIFSAIAELKVIYEIIIIETD